MRTNFLASILPRVMKEGESEKAALNLKDTTVNLDKTIKELEKKKQISKKLPN